MSKRAKQLQAIRNNPKNTSFKTIRNVLINHGFIETSPKSGSSHYTYKNGIYRITVPKDKPINEVYIKQAIKIIDELEANL